MNEVMSFLFFIFVCFCYDSMSAYIAYLIDGSKMPYRKIFLWQIPVSFIQSAVIIAWGSVPDSPNIIINNLLITIWRVFEIAITVSWVFFLFRKKNIKKRFFYVFLIFPFCIISNYSAYMLIELLMWKNPGFNAAGIIWTPKVFFLYFGLYALTHAGVALIVRLVLRTSFWGKLQAFGNYPRLYVPVGVICFLSYSIFARFGGRFMSYPWFFVAISVFSLALLFAIVLMVSDIKKTENLTAAQNLLLHQQGYINKLESIQQEIRNIQHDYKNMLLGLYAHASEGNAEAVREYIDTKLLRVDETIREDLRQMNQLARIELPELKGLIMTKMMEAERDGIPFRLEVMFTVNQVPMSAEDLLRCVGILMDNAIEEARAQQGSMVTLLLLQEDKALTIVVKNPVREKPDLAQIRNKGYSTKGSNRGVGLYNYQNIIQKYPGTIQETKIEREQFVQVLVLVKDR